MARTEARLDATGAVTRRRPDGSWERVEPRTDWARVDATIETEIEHQAALDDAEAAKDAAAWVRRVRRRAGTVASRVCAPDGYAHRDDTRLGAGQARAPGRGPRPSARDRPSAGSRARPECELNPLTLNELHPTLSLRRGMEGEPGWRRRRSAISMRR